MKIVLFDRDGTIIVDPPDLRMDSVDEIELFPDTIESLKLLAGNGFAAIFITNQAAIAEEHITEGEFWQIQEEVLKQLAPSGIKIIKTYMDPSGEDEVNEWRKPAPGMLLQAAKDFNLNLADTYMVGDRKSDIMAGINAGTKTILVETANTSVVVPEAIYTAPNLLNAAQYIVSHAH